jgi:hypothetical protein
MDVIPLLVLIGLGNTVGSGGIKAFIPLYCQETLQMRHKPPRRRVNA